MFALMWPSGAGVRRSVPLVLRKEAPRTFPSGRFGGGQADGGIGGRLLALSLPFLSGGGCVRCEIRKAKVGQVASRRRDRPQSLKVME